MHRFPQWMSNSNDNKNEDDTDEWYGNGNFGWDLNAAQPQDN